VVRRPHDCFKNPLLALHHADPAELGQVHSSIFFFGQPQLLELIDIRGPQMPWIGNSMPMSRIVSSSHGSRGLMTDPFMTTPRKDADVNAAPCRLVAATRTWRRPLGGHGGSPLPFGSLGVSHCRRYAILFAEPTEWFVPWLPRVLPNVLEIARHHPDRTLLTRFIPPREPERRPERGAIITGIGAP